MEGHYVNWEGKRRKYPSFASAIELELQRSRCRAARASEVEVQSQSERARARENISLYICKYKMFQWYTYNLNGKSERS